ncbi:MAG: hypothetical protein QXK06_00400 [Candidatus Diapherotrites archaeon]
MKRFGFLPSVFYCLAMFGLIFTLVAAQEEVRQLSIKIEGLRYVRHETVTITALFDGQPVAGVDVNVFFKDLNLKKQTKTK